MTVEIFILINKVCCLFEQLSEPHSHQNTFHLILRLHSPFNR